MACDLCGEARKTYRSVTVARLADDTTESMDVCFLCHREGQRGRTWDRESRSYVDFAAHAAALQAAEDARQLEWLRAHPNTTPADLENLADIPF